MKRPHLTAHEETLNAWWDLIPTDATYLLKYNAYRRALVNEGYIVRITYDQRHSVTRTDTGGVTNGKPKKQKQTGAKATTA